jgi:hypothetical protein
MLVPAHGEREPISTSTWSAGLTSSDLLGSRTPLWATMTIFWGYALVAASAAFAGGQVAATWTSSVLPPTLTRISTTLLLLLGAAALCEQAMNLIADSTIRRRSEAPQRHA